MRLTKGHQRWVYWTCGALLASGVLWLVFHYFVRIHGEFGEMPHPLEHWWLRLHGALAMLFLVVAGSLMPIHVRRGWHQRKNLLAGLLLLATAFALTLSGYALYYFGGEELRPFISVFHWAIGLGAPALVVWHILRGRAMRRAHAAVGHGPAQQSPRTYAEPARVAPWPQTAAQGKGPSASA